MTAPHTVSPEYSIYAYDSFHDEKLGHNKWHKLLSGGDEDEILNHAQTLFESQKYQKIEVKKRLYSDKKGKNISYTCRVYDADKKPMPTKLMVAMGLLTIISAFALIQYL